MSQKSTDTLKGYYNTRVDDTDWVKESEISNHIDTILYNSEPLPATGDITNTLQSWFDSANAIGADLTVTLEPGALYTCSEVTWSGAGVLTIHGHGAEIEFNVVPVSGDPLRWLHMWDADGFEMYDVRFNGNGSEQWKNPSDVAYDGNNVFLHIRTNKNKEPNTRCIWERCRFRDIGGLAAFRFIAGIKNGWNKILFRDCIWETIGMNGADVEADTSLGSFFYAQGDVWIDNQYIHNSHIVDAGKGFSFSGGVASGKEAQLRNGKMTNCQFNYSGSAGFVQATEHVLVDNLLCTKNGESKDGSRNDAATGYYKADNSGLGTHGREGTITLKNFSLSSENIFGFGPEVWITQEVYATKSHPDFDNPRSRLHNIHILDNGHITSGGREGGHFMSFCSVPDGTNEYLTNGGFNDPCTSYMCHNMRPSAKRNTFYACTWNAAGASSLPFNDSLILGGMFLKGWHDINNTSRYMFVACQWLDGKLRHIISNPDTHFHSCKWDTNDICFNATVASDEFGYYYFKDCLFNNRVSTDIMGFTDPIELYIIDCRAISDRAIVDLNNDAAMTIGTIMNNRGIRVLDSTLYSKPELEIKNNWYYEGNDPKSLTEQLP